MSIFCRITLLMLLWLAACGNEATASRGSNSVAGVAAGTSCRLSNLTQRCSCINGLPGSQTCVDKAWTQCTCRASAASAGGRAQLPGGNPGNDSPVRFDWERTQPSLGSCEAGHYEGTFSGIYGPSIIVVSNLKVIPVFPVDLPGSPGLEFDLAREGSGEIFTVQNGKMNGNALAAFPFTADIVGKLDCEAMKFDAMLKNGTYSIGPLDFNFEGPLTADYNKQTHSFVGGAWQVTEPAYPSAGGGGDWSAHWLHN